MLSAACGGSDDSSTSGGGGFGGGGMGATGGFGATGGGGIGATGGGGIGATGGGGIGATGGGGTGGTGTDADGDGSPAGTDCDDNNKDVNPSATEVCNGIDDNCAGGIDEGVTVTFYADGDADGYGVDAAGTNKQDCAAPTGYADKAGDCDDKDGTAYPGNTEVCDGKDNDCKNGVDDGVTKNTYYKDSDGDGYGGATTQQACTPPDATWVLQGNDCDDADKARFPGNPEICDTKDNDCDSKTTEPGATTYYQDKDADGYGSTVTQTACGTAPTGYVNQGGDCNDADAKINPLAIELCDNIDNNCINGIDEGPVQVWPDKDGDTYGDAKGTASFMCAVKAGYADDNKDCNDANKAINPAAAEIPGNGVDENCDGSDTNAGTLCGGDSYASPSIPDYITGALTVGDATNGPVAGAYLDDVEVSSTAGQTFTIMYGRYGSSAITPRIYTYGPNSCTSNTRIGIAGYGPHGQYKSRQLITNATAGYYYNQLTTTASGQSGSWQYQTLAGDLGGSCGKYDSNNIWPNGWRVSTSLLSVDAQAAGTSPVPTGFYSYEHEAYLTAGQTYTLLQGGSTFTDRLYLSKAGACATSLGTSSSGITNGGARHVYAVPTGGTGIYTLWPTTTVAGATGAFQANVVPGDVGASCFVGAGSIAGQGDTYVLWPLGGTVPGSLVIGDRVGDWGTTRYFDDYETWMEYGEKINVTVNVTSGTLTPRIYISRAGSCATSLANSTQLSGTTATVSYTVPTAGIYVINVTSVYSNQTGYYNISTTY